MKTRIFLTLVVTVLAFVGITKCLSWLNKPSDLMVWFAIGGILFALAGAANLLTLIWRKAVKKIA